MCLAELQCRVCACVQLHCALAAFRRPFALKGYSLRSSENYVRGDPRCWRLEAETEGGWATLHRVTNYNFLDRNAPVTFYLQDNEVVATRCGWACCCICKCRPAGPFGYMLLLHAACCPLY